jgi:hypothetical protein
MFRHSLLAIVLAASVVAAHAENTLTAEEKAAGWRLLFDGASTAGWHAIGKTGVPADWTAEEGELRLRRTASGSTLHTDIVTDDKFSDFEVTWDWKIAEGGNSGLKYNLPDENKNVGCEYQLLDDEKHPDGKLHDGTRTTASLYDVIAPPADKKLNAPGQWNQSRIVVQGNHVVQYLNGAKTVEFDFGSDELKAKIEASKFKKTAGWGVKTASPLLLQDHGDEITFRNIKIRVPAEK